MPFGGLFKFGDSSPARPLAGLPWPAADVLPKLLFPIRLTAFMLCALALGLSVQPTRANTVDVQQVDLYSVEFQVESRSRNERRRLLSSALTEVFVRCTGDSTALQTYPVLGSKLSAASGMLRSYLYEERTAPVLDAGVLAGMSGGDAPESSDPPGQETGSPGDREQLWLTLHFDHRAVQTALRQANAPFWQARRPVLNVEIDDRSYYADEQSIQLQEIIIERLLQQSARRRGLPITIDIAQSNVQLGDDAPDPETNRTMTEASISYRDQPSATGLTDLPVSASAWLLTGEIAEVSGSYIGYWSMRSESSSPGSSVSLRRQPLQALVDAGIDLAADRIAEQYAIAADSGGADTTLLTIVGIKNSHDYLALVNLLNEQPVLASAQLKEADGDMLVFALERSVQRNKLRSLINLTGRLGADESTDDLVFQWLE